MARKDISTLTVLQTVKANPIEGCVQSLSAQTGQCEKVCLRALERELGKIEYGVSINRPWLTPEGEAWLAEVNPDLESSPWT